MTLDEYVQKLVVEHDINHQVTDIVDHVVNMAEKELKGKNGAIDDETVKKWVLEYEPEKKAETKAETKIEKPIGVVKEVKGEWGEQQSLF